MPKQYAIATVKHIDVTQERNFPTQQVKSRKITYPITYLIYFMLRQYTTENMDALARISEQAEQVFFSYDILSDAFTHLSAAYEQ